MQSVDKRDLENPQEIVIMNNTFNMYGTIDRPLFLAIDIANMIEYSLDKTDQMLELVDDDEKLTDTIYRAGQRREMWFVTEAGLYELLMQSRKPLAKKFKLGIKSLLHKIRTGEVRLSSVGSVGDRTLVFENVHTIFRNFAGEEKRFNRAGDRNFSIVIEDSEKAQQLAEDGWNIKVRPANDKYPEPMYYLPVSVRFDNFPPNVTMISGRVRTKLDEETIGELDKAKLSVVDATISGSKWDVNGKSGMKAYLKSMYAVISRDPLDAKYDDYEEDDELPFN